jgi:eukaryotic translation initiation factor 2C
MIKERLGSWRSNNNKILPTTIVWYRDGVSESQFDQIASLEIPEIRKAYTELKGDHKDLRITFIVVGKRHHTRFYAANKNGTYQSHEKTPETGEIRNFDNGNLRPGLLVDDVVTAPKPFNFFLQSHAAIKGTARSAHYYVLEDSSGITPINLQNLTMMMCYAFGRSTTAVSYASPAYIADRLCERGRAYLRLWAEDEWMQPVANIITYTDGQGNASKPTDAELLAEKQKMVDKLLASEEVWGKSYNDGSKPGPTRLNPWHPNLDDGMFWM